MLAGGVSFCLIWNFLFVLCFERERERGKESMKVSWSKGGDILGGLLEEKGMIKIHSKQNF